MQSGAAALAFVPLYRYVDPQPPGLYSLAGAVVATTNIVVKNNNGVGGVVNSTQTQS